MTGIEKMNRDARVRAAQQVDQPLGFRLWNDRIHISGTDPYILRGKIGQRFGNERHHCSKQNRGRQNVGSKQQYTGGNIRPIGIANSNDLAGGEPIMPRRCFDKIRQLVGTPFQVFQVKDTLSESPKKARHSIFEDFAARTEQCCSRVQLMSEREKIALAAPGPVQEEEGSVRGSGNKPVKEVEGHWDFRFAIGSNLVGGSTAPRAMSNRAAPPFRFDNAQACAFHLCEESFNEFSIFELRLNSMVAKGCAASRHRAGTARSTCHSERSRGISGIISR
jgi:hypothetical protein